MGVDSTLCLPSTRPVRWVMNWVDAAYLSCRPHESSIILHPSASNRLRNAWHFASCRHLTTSYTKGRPCQPYRPLSGPNIGWVQRMSTSIAPCLSSAKRSSRTFLGHSLTLRTSTRRMFRRSAPDVSSFHSATHRLNRFMTLSKERIDVQMTNTLTPSAIILAKSMPGTYATPKDRAISDWSERDVPTTGCFLANVLARNCPKLPNPTMPIFS
mmetsp:Transcript_20380/g.58179  ORF Transcript_20380/g.58179 Transcript_20380/m.58179 type:complete len:213 (-) Transcript_20380:458-1096(-)